MKKIILLVISIICLCSCSDIQHLIVPDIIFLNNSFEKLVDAIKDSDASAITKMFSKSLQNELDDLSEKSDELLDYVQGDIVSYEYTKASNGSA